MSVTQVVLEHIIATIGSASLIVTGLSAYIGKRISDRSNIFQKAAFDKDIQSIKHEHASSMLLIEKEIQVELAKKDRFHQISKGTFEKIFESKIEIYTNLIKLKIDFFKFLDEDYALEVGIEDPTDEFYSLFMRCRESLESNKLYISDELSNKYDQWHKKAAPFLKQANIEGFHAHGLAHTENKNNQNVWEAEAPILSEMIHATMEEMKSIFSQVDKDIILIRSNINAPMRQTGT